MCEGVHAGFFLCWHLILALGVEVFGVALKTDGQRSQAKGISGLGVSPKPALCLGLRIEALLCRLCKNRSEIQEN